MWCIRETLTSIYAVGQQVPPANWSFKLRSWPVNQSTGLASLGLGPPTVAELRANYKKTFRRRLRRDQPVGEKTEMMQEENVTKCQWIEQLYNCLSPSEICQHFFNKWCRYDVRTIWSLKIFLWGFIMFFFPFMSKIKPAINITWQYFCVLFCNVTAHTHTPNCLI